MALTNLQRNRYKSDVFGCFYQLCQSDMWHSLDELQMMLQMDMQCSLPRPNDYEEYVMHVLAKDKQRGYLPCSLYLTTSQKHNSEYQRAICKLILLRFDQATIDMPAGTAFAPQKISRLSGNN